MKHNIVLYTGSNCNHCKAIKKFMQTNNIEFEERNIDNEEYKNQITEKGFMSIPVLVIDGEYYLVNVNNFIGYLKDVF